MDSKEPKERPEPGPWVFPELPIITPGPASTRPDLASFGPLPIITPPPASTRTEVEKYGTLFYVAIAGLVVVLALLTWFGVSVYRLSDLWAEVYTLNDRTRPEADRVQAAVRLSHDHRLDDNQRFEMSTSRDLPDRARYVLAESVGTDAVAHDPRAFALAVARSPNWPVWMRLLYTRLLAYSAAKQFGLPRVALEELASENDSMTRIWAACALLFLPDPPAGLNDQLEAASHLTDADGELARRMLEALHAPADQRAAIFHAATQWLRQNHPEAVRIWREPLNDQNPISAP